MLSGFDTSNDEAEYSPNDERPQARCDGTVRTRQVRSAVRKRFGRIVPWRGDDCVGVKSRSWPDWLPVAGLRLCLYSQAVRGSRAYSGLKIQCPSRELGQVATACGG